MTRRLLISIALGAAELAWDALRKAPGKAWAAAHAWLVVRAGERERAKREPRDLDDMTEAEIEAELRADGVDVDAFVARMREAVDKARAAERTRVAKTPAEVAQGRPCPIHGFSRSSCDCAALFACEDAPAKLGKDGPR